MAGRDKIPVGVSIAVVGADSDDAVEALRELRAEALATASEAYHYLWLPGANPTTDLSRSAARSRLSRYQHVLATRHGRPVGIAALSPHGQISDLFVTPTARRKNLARDMLGVLTELAWINGAPAAQIWVPREESWSRLWKVHRFRPVQAPWSGSRSFVKLSRALLDEEFSTPREWYRVSGEGEVEGAAQSPAA